MIRIIDRTLSALDYEKNKITPAQLKHFIFMLAKAGADVIELPPKAYELLGSIPEGIKPVMRVNHCAEIALFKGFDQYIAKTKEESGPWSCVHEIQVNDIREIEWLIRYKHLKDVCITGLDDLMVGDYAQEMKKILSIFGKNVWFCPENDLNCATAMAVEWIFRGGRNIMVSFAGIGGYAAFEEVILAARIALRQRVSIDLTILPRLTALFEEMTQTKIPVNKAVLGSNIFMVESGIHADGISKNPSIYEPYPPKSVGKERKIIIGKHSGRSAVRTKAEELGVMLDEIKSGILLDKVRHASIMQKRSLSENEFSVFLKEVAGCEAQETYR